MDSQVVIGDHRTNVWVGGGILTDVGSKLRSICSEPVTGILLVTDEIVDKHHSLRVEQSFTDAGFDTEKHVIPPGEGSKCATELLRLYDALLAVNLDRFGVIVALGGGVVSDLAGVAAATWLRGVRLAVLPTTLEADIDAAIGGKSAINFRHAKNLIGAFHQPCLIAIDPDCLSTLDLRDVRAGLAESVKHALITDEGFLKWHEANGSALLALDRRILGELIRRNVDIKLSFVQRDAYDRNGQRVMLNFGHTIGHAIEACCEYRLRHGECVALGMIAACRISHRMGLLDPSVTARVEALLGRLALPTTLSDPMGTGLIFGALRKDKKSTGGGVTFVLLEGIGKPVTRQDLPLEFVQEAYESLWAGTSGSTG